MPTKIKPAQFADAVQEYIEEFKEEAVEANEKAVRAVAKEVTKELKAGAPVRTGAFKRALTNEVKETRLSVEATVGAKKPYYRLTHLLEFGHQLKRGGRKIGEVDAHPFVKDVNDKVEEKYMKKMEELLTK